VIIAETHPNPGATAKLFLFTIKKIIIIHNGNMDKKVNIGFFKPSGLK